MCSYVTKASKLKVLLRQFLDICVNSVPFGSFSSVCLVLFRFSFILFEFFFQVPAGKGVGVWLGGEVERIWEGRENHNQNILYGKKYFFNKRSKVSQKKIKS